MQKPHGIIKVLTYLEEQEYAVLLLPTEFMANFGCANNNGFPNSWGIKKGAVKQGLGGNKSGRNWNKK